MAIGYVVREPFGDYSKGDLISDPARVAELDAAGDRHHHLLRVNVDVAAPAPKTAPAN